MIKRARGRERDKREGDREIEEKKILSQSNHMAAAQRVEVDGKVVSQLCDEERNLTSEQFEEAMRKQVFTTVGFIINSYSQSVHMM